ncbi:MAG: nucleotidyltransferase domain-containing protein [Nocardioides sp.]|uniref:nucleotidyltransferase domain-containing protein n=1 Tax=Nocardioides sp. TaxID=35761 RepID=UPI0039E59EA8
MPVKPMPDPFEGIEQDGTIKTGARRDRVPPQFAAVVREAIAAVEHDASLYLYGSVANGTARPGSSDVDLLSIDLPSAAAVATRLSREFAQLCRGVEVAAATADDFVGESDEAYGNRVFLRHYCIHLAGPDHAVDLPAFPADARAARGFNGDLAQHLRRWRDQHESGAAQADVLGVRIARKTLLAVAGLVSVHDRTWTTSRSVGAQRWTEIEPELGSGLSLLESWADGSDRPTHPDVTRALNAPGVVPAIVERFSNLIGLWPDTRRTR